MNWFTIHGKKSKLPVNSGNLDTGRSWKKMTMTEVLYLIGGIILTSAALPQITQLYLTKNSEGLNLLTFFMLTIGNILKMFYAIYTAINGYGLVIIITTSLSLLNILTLTILIVYYRFYHKGAK